MACLCQRHVVVLPSSRAFSTSTRRGISLHIKSNLREDVADVVPEYPYGSAQWYKQAQKGLYGGSKIQFGNTTGEKNMPRARRSWGLNVKRKRLFSEALNQTVQLQVTTRVLRTIHKYGGLDEYLLGEKPARLKELGETGWWLRWAIMQTDTVKARFAEETQALLAKHAQVDEESTLPKTDSPASGTSPESGSATEELIPDDKQVSSSAAESSSNAPEPISLTPQHRRLTFRVDRRKHVVFNGRTWVTDHKRVQRVGWERDLAKVAKLQHQRTPSEDVRQETAAAAAEYIKASLANKKLQRGMPPSVVNHRQWLKKNTDSLNRSLGLDKAPIPERMMIVKSLQHNNHEKIARAIYRRTKATAYKR